MLGTVIVLVCLLGQTKDDCVSKPLDKIDVAECGSAADCYIRAMSAVAPFIDDKSYPLVQMNSSPVAGQ